MVQMVHGLHPRNEHHFEFELLHARIVQTKGLTNRMAVILALYEPIRGVPIDLTYWF